MPFQKGHKFGKGNPAKNLTEAQIRYAMANSRSNFEAARFLNVANETYKKYAKAYIDSNTGKSLYDIHKNQFGRGIKKPQINIKSSRLTSLEDIFAGKKLNIKPYILRDRLIRNCILEEKCSECGFNERRVIDYQIPLLLDFIDGNHQNMAKDNLRLLCYNHTFLLRGSLHGRTKSII
jgi:hypothetical protein